MRIVLRNLELLLKWTQSDVERKMIQESIEYIKAQIKKDEAAICG